MFGVLKIVQKIDKNNTENNTPFKNTNLYDMLKITQDIHNYFILVNIIDINRQI